MTPTADRLRELVNYDPETGIFTHRVSRARSNIVVGEVCGGLHNGYVRMRIDGKHYRAHRMAWLYVHGELPSHIDHINCNRSDNRIANLRKADGAQNLWNTRPYKTNSSGAKSVFWNKGHQKWRVQIRARGKLYQVGGFTSLEEAIVARDAALVLHHGQFARSERGGYEE